jgi:hypothetical protein
MFWRQLEFVLAQTVFRKWFVIINPVRESNAKNRHSVYCTIPMFMSDINKRFLWDALVQALPGIPLREEELSLFHSVCAGVWEQYGNPQQPETRESIHALNTKVFELIIPTIQTYHSKEDSLPKTESKNTLKRKKEKVSKQRLPTIIEESIPLTDQKEEKTSSSQELTPMTPNPDPVKIKPKEMRFTIDSRLRNTFKWPQTNHYKFTLPVEANGSLTLKRGYVPQSQLCINSKNNRIYFQESKKHIDKDEVVQAIIEPGDYTPEKLAKKIEEKMNKAGNNIYHVEVDTVNKHLVITATYPDAIVDTSKETESGEKMFNLMFGNGIEYHTASMGQVLGFSPESYSDDDTYTSDRQYNLTGESYCWLILKSSTGDKIGKVRIPFMNTPDGDKKKEQEINVDIGFLKGKEIEIMLCDYAENPYQTYGAEHTLEFVCSV